MRTFCFLFIRESVIDTGFSNLDHRFVYTINVTLFAVQQIYQLNNKKTRLNPGPTNRPTVANIREQNSFCAI